MTPSSVLILSWGPEKSNVGHCKHNTVGSSIPFDVYICRIPDDPTLDGNK